MKVEFLGQNGTYTVCLIIWIDVCLDMHTSHRR